MIHLQGLQGQSSFNQEDLRVSTKAVGDKITMQHSMSEDYDLTDLTKQTVRPGQYPKADLNPLTFLPNF